jgi:hypothetical protein
MCEMCEWKVVFAMNTIKSPFCHDLINNTERLQSYKSFPRPVQTCETCATAAGLPAGLSPNLQYRYETNFWVTKTPST